MSYKSREEIVGKRFLSVQGSGKLKLKQFNEWDWRAGVVRAVTVRELDSDDVSVRFLSKFY